MITFNQTPSQQIIPRRNEEMIGRTITRDLGLDSDYSDNSIIEGIVVEYDLENDYVTLEFNFDGKIDQEVIGCVKFNKTCCLKGNILPGEYNNHPNDSSDDNNDDKSNKLLPKRRSSRRLFSTNSDREGKPLFEFSGNLSEIHSSDENSNKVEVGTQPKPFFGIQLE